MPATDLVSQLYAAHLDEAAEEILRLREQLSIAQRRIERLNHLLSPKRTPKPSENWDEAELIYEHLYKKEFV